MPHEGHRIPKNITMVQGGKPNCWCVPIPALFGVNRLATMSGAISATPNSTNPARDHHGNRPAGSRAEGSTAKHHPGRENSDAKRHRQARFPQAYAPKSNRTTPLIRAVESFPPSAAPYDFT